MGEWHFRRLLEKTPVGAYTCDADRLITFNPQAVELEGRAPALNGNRPLDEERLEDAARGYPAL